MFNVSADFITCLCIHILKSRRFHFLNFKFRLDYSWWRVLASTVNKPCLRVDGVAASYMADALQLQQLVCDARRQRLRPSSTPVAYCQQFWALSVIVQRFPVAVAGTCNSLSPKWRHHNRAGVTGSAYRRAEFTRGCYCACNISCINVPKCIISTLNPQKFLWWGGTLPL